MSQLETTVGSPAAGSETIIDKPVNLPFNAICLIQTRASPSDPNYAPGTGFIVKTKDGGLAVITAGHVLKDPALHLDATGTAAKAKCVKVYPGTYKYLSDGNFESTSPALTPNLCIVHESFDPKPTDAGSALHDIGIAFLPKDAKLKGLPMSWGAPAARGPVAATAYSVTGHREFTSTDVSELAQMRMVRIDPYKIAGPADARLFNYTSRASSLGPGLSGGPVMATWAAKPDAVKTAVAFGHHLRSTAPNPKTGAVESAPAATTYFTALCYSGDVADWLRKKGL